MDFVTLDGGVDKCDYAPSHGRRSIVSKYSVLRFWVKHDIRDRGGEPGFGDNEQLWPRCIQEVV